MTDIISFDPAYYLKQYPALADYGYNEANAQQHFVQYGAAELRLPSAEFEGKLTESSVFNYYEQNPELADALGIARLPLLPPQS